MPVIVDFHGAISVIDHPAIAAAIRRYFVEKPRGVMFFRVSLFAGRIRSEPPLVGPLCYLECLAIGGQKIDTGQELLLHCTEGTWAVSPFQKHSVYRQGA